MYDKGHEKQSFSVLAEDAIYFISYVANEAKIHFDLNEESELEKTLERAFSYFIYRHCAEVESYEELCASVGFALFCERLLASVLKNGEFPIAGATVSAAVALSEEIEYSEENTEAIKNEFWF